MAEGSVDEGLSSILSANEPECPQRGVGHKSRVEIFGFITPRGLRDRDQVSVSAQPPSSYDSCSGGFLCVAVTASLGASR